MNSDKIEIELKGVPETLLWTLHNRAVESKRQDGIIKDIKAEQIFDKINYNYERSFGKAEPSHAVRSLLCDNEIKKFIQNNPNCIIINLGEGLETQRYRINTDGVIWYSVDLEESIKLREKFIQPDDEHKHIACSILDDNWSSDIPKDRPTIITAQGLLMYFEEYQVKAIINNIANHFKQATFVFDTTPLWYSKKTMKGLQITNDYQAPKMPWGIDRDNIKETLLGWESKITNIEFLSYQFPRGYIKVLFKIIPFVPIVRNKMPTGVKIEISNR